MRLWNNGACSYSVGMCARGWQLCSISLHSNTRHHKPAQCIARTADWRPNKVEPNACHHSVGIWTVLFSKTKKRRSFCFFFIGNVVFSSHYQQ